MKNQRRGGGPGWWSTLDARSLVERHWSLKRPGARLCWEHSFLKKALSRKCSTPLSQPAFAPFSQGPHQSQWVRLEPGHGGAGLKGSSEEGELLLSLFFSFYICIFTWEHTLFVNFFFLTTKFCNILAFHKCFQTESLSNPTDGLVHIGFFHTDLYLHSY